MGDGVMTSSGTGSRSSARTQTTSIAAIVYHYSELYESMIEVTGTRGLTQRVLDEVTGMITRQEIRTVWFYGLNAANQIELALIMDIDWAQHRLVVQGGDRVELPLRDGKLRLTMIRNIAHVFAYEVLRRNLQL